MSLYVGPYSMCQLIADTPEELEESCHRLQVEVDWPVMLDPKKRPWALGLGAIELSRRELVTKIGEIDQYGRGLGPNLKQIGR